MLFSKNNIFINFGILQDNITLIEVAWVGQVCEEIDAKTIPLGINFHTILVSDGAYCGATI